MVLAFSGWWVVGWVIGFGGAVVAAILLVLIIRLAGQIASQARDITTALQGARDNTTPLFDVARTNLELDHATRALGELAADAQASGAGAGEAPAPHLREGGW